MATNNNSFAEESRSYMTPPRFGGQYVMGVAAMLRNAAPADLDASEGAALSDLEAAARAVMEVLVERDRFSAARIRPNLTSYVAVWGAFGDILGGIARIPASFHHPLAEKATTLHASLLPDGVGFLRLDAHAAWFEGKKRLDRIAAEGMTADLTSVVGEPLLSALTTATRELGDAIGVGVVTRDVPSRTALWDRTGDFAQAVGTYCRVLIGRVNERAPASVERFRRAVAPIDEYRLARAQRSGDEADDALDATPTNAIPPGMPGSSPFITPPAT